MMLEKGKCDWCLGGYETILIIINILHVHVCVLCNKILLSVLFMITWIPFCFLHSKAKLQLIWQKNMVTKKSFHYWEILKKRKRSVFYEPYNFCHFSTELFSFANFSCAVYLIRCHNLFKLEGKCLNLNLNFIDFDLI